MTTPSQSPTSGIAITSLIFGIVSLLGGCLLCAIPPVVAIITGHIGVAQTGAGRRGGRALAVTGLVIGYMSLLLGLFGMAFIAFNPEEVGEFARSITG